VYSILSLPASGQGDNPFEIKARKGVALSDSLTIQADSFSLDNHVSFVEKKQMEMMDENPFNVSHIPVRRTKVAETKVVETPVADIEVAEKDTNTEIEAKPNKVTAPAIIKDTGSGGKKFLFWFFLIQLLLITSILGINREFIKKINRSISNDNFAKLVGRDYNSGYDALFAIMYLLFILSLSIFIYLASLHFFGIKGFSRFVVFLFSVAGVYLFRHMFLGFMGFVFPFTKAVSYYNFMIILFNSYLGLLLIPINVLMAYSPPFFANIALYIGIGFIIIMYLLRFLRGSLHAYTFIRNHIFHFFLYLCTCEIAPLFILVRFLGNSFSN
jgi:hypothetical protein